MNHDHPVALRHMAADLAAATDLAADHKHAAEIAIEDRNAALAKLEGAGLRQIQNDAWQNSEDKGFHRAHETMPSWQASAYIKLALITTEVAEATEELRKTKHSSDLLTSGWGSELADILIRLADLAEDTSVDLWVEVDSKLAHTYTEERVHE